MRDQIQDLERESAVLEPNDEQRKSLRESIVDYTESFLQEIHDLDKRPAFKMTTTGLDLKHTHFSEDPVAVDKVIDLVKRNVDEEGLNPASGGDLGYIPAGGIYSSSLGDYWAAITNRYAGIFYANPGAVRMENQLINWVKSITGYPDSALGNLASGGSIANLIAIVAARDAHNIISENIPKQVIYLSKQAHHCIDKAIKIAGLKECVIRFIDVDEQYRMEITHLQQCIQKDIKAGLRPWLLIGSAGTTDTGAVDPLNAMADIADTYKLWFHVDAAYGGFFLLCSHGREKFRGLERSHSVVLDPHKGLFIPYGIGIVIVRSGEDLQKSFAYHANYMQDAVDLADEISPAEISPELTKHFRGLRMWLPMMIYGLKPFRSALKEKLLLTRYAYEQLQKLDHLVVGPEPELSIMTFRFMPPHLDPNSFNQAVLREIHNDGRIFLSSTTIENNFIIRLAILSFRTHLKEIDLTISILREKYSLVYQKFNVK